MYKKQIFLLLVLGFANLNVNAEFLERIIDKNKERFSQVALDIWEFAEMGYLETKSSELLASELQKEGFKITKNVANIPTAFIAEYGSGGPIIGILGEFDALPGLAQSNSPFKEEVNNETGAGHACGHHLFGAASAWAAVTIKEWLENNNVAGTVRFYGTPAEEGGSGKVYMVREGLFNDVDIVLHWHPDDTNSANSRSSNSNKSARFTFKGISSHAAGAPEQGRSALDGVESMNMMVNLLREHIPQESRIHYVITKGGLAPNVVPDLAEVYYYVRHPQMHMVEELFNRVVKTAEGAAIGTDTKMTYEVMHGNYSLLPNEVIQKIMHKNLLKFGGIKYSKEENEYASKIYKTLVKPSLEIGSQEFVNDYKISHSYGSTDVGDVSWVVPTAGVRTATWVPGTAAHSWQAVAAGGTSIGLKGTELAAKTISATAIEIFNNPYLINDAKKELQERVGEDFQYKALLGDRKPPLNYRVN
ncbi:MAG: amidohydrolase [Proteobacteria bacterium]|nr:amidohydrolase [Pseudomonadota bacterium]